MSKFRTKYSRVRCFTPVGSPEVTQYVGKYDKDGVLQLEVSGIVNLYDQIQSHADSVDINTIISRYENGEVDVLARVQGVYEDVTGAPRTYAEMLNMIRAGEEIFEQLPADLRAQYNNSFEQFFAQGGMDMLLDPVPAPAVPEVKTEEVTSDES